MSGLFAQAQAEPDLTVPIAVIVACAAIILVTLVVQWARGRRRDGSAAPADLSSGPEAPQ